jgi:hypothetical protein
MGEFVFKDIVFIVKQKSRSAFYDEQIQGNRYRFTIEVETHRPDIMGKISFFFHDSIANYEKGIKTLPDKDILWALECFLLDAISFRGLDLDNFAKEFCDGMPVSKINETYAQCKLAHRKLLYILKINDEEITELEEFLREKTD